MTLSIGTLLEETKRTFHFEIIAGSDGLYRTPLWLYFSEDLENIDFLQGGELIIITGFNCMGSSRLYTYAKSIAKKNASGLIINTGKYIMPDEIPENVIAFCNEAQLPLITMPWEIHLVDVTRVICQKIFESNHQYDDISHILKALISGDKLSHRDVALLEDGALPLKAEYVITSLSIKDFHISEHLISLTIDEYFHKMKAECTYLHFQGYHVLLFKNCKTADICSHMKALFEKLYQISKCGKITYGIGEIVGELELISKSFLSSLEALRFATEQKQDGMLFDDLGIYRLFFSLPDKTILKSYYSCLEPLLEYDRVHNGELMKTLSIYLNCNRSVKEVADKLFCHRNTINYRINLIKDLLARDFQDEQFVFELQFGFHVLHYLEL